MRTEIRLFFALSLLLSCSCLHLSLHRTLQTYVSALNSNQHTFFSDLNDLNGTILQQENAIAAESDQNKRITLLEDLIVMERQRLADLYATVTIPLNESGWTCQQLTSAQSTALNNDLTSLANAAKDAQKIADSNIPNGDSLSQLANLTKATDQQIQDNLNSAGTQSPSQPQQVNVPNLLASNWIAPNNTLAGLSPNYTANSSQFPKTCPLPTPFVDSNNQCIACNNQFYNIKSKSCVNCNNPDITNRVCLDPPVYTATNLTAGKGQLLLPSNQSYSTLPTSPNDVVCPAATPFFDGSKCLSCAYQFDYTNRICSQCPQNTQYLPLSFNCSLPSITVTNTGNTTGLLLPKNTTLAQYQNGINASAAGAVATPCPAKTPFYNGTDCLGCSQNLVYSVESKTCLTCPFGQYYNQTTLHCEDIILYSNLANQAWSTSKTPDSVVAQVLNQSSQPGAQICPTSAPFFNGKVCVNCTSPTNIFSFDTLQCIQCSAGTSFSPNAHQCVKSSLQQTNPAKAPNLILDGISRNQWQMMYYNNITANPALSDCPTATPYFDGVTCISCPSSQPYFNMQYRLCQVCDNGTVYDPSISDCITSNGMVATQSPTLEKMAAGIFT